VLPDLLRDLGDRFPRSGISSMPRTDPREAARLFAKVLGHLDTHEAANVARAHRRARDRDAAPAGLPAAARSTPTGLALDVVPFPVRAIEVASGRAADTTAGSWACAA
jgi:hypothetical protein